MRNRKADLPHIKVKNIGAYLDAVKDLKNRHYIIMPNGNEFYCINNEMIPAVCMPSEQPKLQNVGVYKGNNLDGRSNWIE